MLDSFAIVPDVIELGEDPKILPDGQRLRESNVRRGEVDPGEDLFTMAIRIEAQDPDVPVEPLREMSDLDHRIGHRLLPARRRSCDLLPTARQIGG